VTHLPIGTRVRHVVTGTLGTTFSTPYVFLGVRRVGLEWDGISGPAYSVSDVSDLEVLPASRTVPPEARPLSVGALAHPMRGGR
jgi:hypothetical protein